MERSLYGRVLHVGKFFPPHRGGMESFLADLIEEQRRQGLYAIGLVHGQPREEDPSWLHRVRVQTEVLYAPMGIGFPFKLRRLIREFEPDVIHMHMPNNAAFWALVMRSARRIPWIVHWQSDVVPSRVRRALSAAYMLYEPFERAILSQAFGIIATSPSYLAASPTLQPWLDKCKVIPLGLVDQSQTGAHSPASALPTPAPSGKTFWRPGAFRLLSIGRLVYYKGFETLVRAVASIPGVQLLIAGEGEMRPALEELIASFASVNGEPPSVQLLGSVSEADKHALLATCDVFCLASCERTESFGLVLIEAMQHSKPCIVSDLPGSGMPWVVGEAGAGLSVPLDDLAAWQAAINRLRDSPELRQQMGTSGLHAAAGKFSIKECARRVAAFYAEAAPDIRFTDPDKDTLVILHARSDSPVQLTHVQALRNAGWTDLVIVGEQSTPQSVGEVPVLRPAITMNGWNSIQMGLRYALRRGYRNAITVSMNNFPDPHALHALEHARQAPDEPDVVIGASAHPPSRRRRLAWQWFKTLAGLDLLDPASTLRLYNHDAMVVSASREATLLDYEDIGTLVLFRKARLRITEVVVPSAPDTPPPVSPSDSLLDTWRYLLATTMLCFSNLSTRRLQRDVRAPGASRTS